MCQWLCVCVCRSDTPNNNKSAINYDRPPSLGHPTRKRSRSQSPREIRTWNYSFIMFTSSFDIYARGCRVTYIYVHYNLITRQSNSSLQHIRTFTHWMLDYSDRFISTDFRLISEVEPVARIESIYVLLIFLLISSFYL